MCLGVPAAQLRGGAGGHSTEAKRPRAGWPVLALLTLAEAEARESFANLGLILAVLSLAGTLVLLRFLERQR